MNNRLSWNLPAAAGLLSILTVGCMEEGGPAARNEVASGSGKTVTLAPPGTKYTQANASAMEDRVSELLREKQKIIAGKGGLPKAASGSAWIEILPKDKDRDCQYRVYLHTDDEDNGNTNKYKIYAFGAWQDMTGKSGWMGGLSHVFGENKNGANSTYTLCQEYVGSLPTARYDYAVMAGSANCPSNSYKFMRHFDTEDNGSTNTTSDEGLAAPNFALRSKTGFTDGGIAEYNFCFVPGDNNSNTPAYPQMSFSDGTSLQNDYMVFSAAPYTWRGQVFTDDEDTNNSNSWTSSDTQDATLIAKMKAIVGSGTDTWVNIGAEGSRPQTAFFVGASCPSKPSPPTCSSTVCPVDWANYKRAVDEWKSCTNTP